MFIDKKIAINTIVRWSGEILNKLMWFFLMVFLAKTLGDRDFGYFSYAFSFGAIFASFTDFGTNIFIMNAVSKNKDKTNFYLSNILGMKTLFTLAVFPLIYVLSFLTAEVHGIVILFSLSLLISAFLDPFNCLYRAYKQMYYETLIILIWRFLLVGLTLVGISFLSFKLLEISYIFLFSGIVVVYLTFLLAKKVYMLNMNSLNFKKWKELFVNSIPFGLVILLGTILFKLNILVLQYFKGAREVGWYSASFRLLEGTFFIPSIFVASVFPFLCEYSKQSNHLLATTFKKAFLILLFLAIPIVVGMFILSDKIIFIFYGEQFLMAAKSLRIMILSLIFIFLNELFLYLFISKDKQLIVIKIMFVAVFVYMVLCLLLIPLKGFVGAALSFLIAQTLLFFLYLRNK